MNEGIFFFKQEIHVPLFKYIQTCCIRWLHIHTSDRGVDSPALAEVFAR